MTDARAIDRFDNLVVTDLVGLRDTAWQRFRDMEGLIERCLRAECLIKLEKVYTVIGGAYYNGRRLYVTALTFTGTYMGEPVDPYLVAHGYLRRPRPDPKRIGFRHGLFTYKCVITRVRNLDPETEGDD